MPAKAGIQSAWHQIFWIPAFAGMTVTDRINSPTAQLPEFGTIMQVLNYG
jgi:hypothetical protein